METGLGLKRPWQLAKLRFTAVEGVWYMCASIKFGVRVIMQLKNRFLALVLFLTLPFVGLWADEFDDTIQIFKDAGENAGLF